MRRIIRFELAKILKRKIVLIGIAVLVIVDIVMMNAYFTTSQGTMATTKDGLWLTGADAIQYNQDVASQYAGDFTDETIQQILDDYTPDTPTERVQNTTYDYVNGFFIVPDDPDFAEYKDKISFSESGNISLKEYGLDFDPPLQYGYGDSWTYFVQLLQFIMVPLGILIVIGVSSVFSDEYSRGTDAIILTTRFGKNKCAIAKIIASLIFSTILVVGIAILNSILFGMKFGFDGWNANIQLNLTALFMQVPVRLSYLGLAGFSILFSWIAMMFLTGTTVLISSLCKTSFVALIISAITFVLPRVIENLFDGSLFQKLLILFPIKTVRISEVLNPSAVFIGDAYNVPYLIVTTAILVLIGSSLISYQAFKKHQVGGR